MRHSKIKSCDFCRNGKRKCDGNQPCNCCLKSRKGPAACVYSTNSTLTVTRSLCNSLPNQNNSTQITLQALAAMVSSPSHRLPLEITAKNPSALKPTLDWKKNPAVIGLSCIPHPGACCLISIGYSCRNETSLSICHPAIRELPLSSELSNALHLCAAIVSSQEPFSLRWQMAASFSTTILSKITHYRFDSLLDVMDCIRALHVYGFMSFWTSQIILDPLWCLGKAVELTKTFLLVPSTWVDARGLTGRALLDRLRRTT